MHVCPNCGTDLERFEPVSAGDLEFSTFEAKWKGHKVPLRPSGRLLLSAIVRAHGVPMSNSALIEALGCDDSRDPGNIVKVQLCRVRRAFERIDPDFHAIETVWGIGYRWSA